MRRVLKNIYFTRGKLVNLKILNLNKTAIKLLQGKANKLLAVHNKLINITILHFRC